MTASYCTRRRRWPWALALLVVVAVAGGLSFTTVVRKIASDRAAQRGLSLELGSATPGWLSVRLNDVVVRPQGVDAIVARLDRVTVRVTPALALHGVEVIGGTVHLKGPPQEVKRQLQDFRKSRKRPAGAGGKGTGGAALSGRQLSVEWTDWDAQGSHHRISGLQFERSARLQQVAFDSAEFKTPRSQWVASKTQLKFSSSEAGPVLTDADIGRVEGTLVLRASAAKPSVAAGVATEVSADPLSGVTPTQDPPSQPERLKKLLSAVSTSGWTNTQSKIEALKRPLKRFLSTDAKFQIREIQLQLVRGSSVLNFGPAPLGLSRHQDELHASFKSPATADGQQLSIEATVPLGAGTIRGQVSGGPVRLGTLGVQDGNFGLLGVDETLLIAATEGTLTSAGLFEVNATGSLKGLAIQRSALGPEALRDMNITWGGNLKIDLAAHKIDVTRGTIGIGRANLLFDGSLHRSDDDLLLKMRLDMPPTPCQDLFEAAPEALLPLLQGLNLGGKMGLHSSVAFDTADIKQTVVEWELNNLCTVLETPEPVDPERFHEPFQHLVLDENGEAMEIEAGPGTDQWVPLEEISPYMQTAVLVCEDAKFFKHRGFNNSAIRDSIASNLKAGRFVRGASTLTMQLAKNLYLGREKTLSRKFQEAALTMLLEQKLNKEDILELYFNVVEFGPGVYGIRQASQHYFNSHPGELSLGQALYFGSILPNPKAVHFKEDGSLDVRWAKHLQFLMRSAHRRERISDEELEAGQKEVLKFGQPHQTAEADFLFGLSLFGDLGN